MKTHLKLSHTDKSMIVFLPLLVCLADQFTKAIAKRQFTHIGAWGPFETGLLSNHGVFLGLSSAAPAGVRTILLCSFGVFLLCIYSVLQFFLPLQARGLRVGLALWLGGIIGNIWDRMLHGAVLDFIEIKTSLFSTAVFNLADVCQWPGIALVLYGLLKYYREFWPEKESRKINLVDSSFQLTMCAILLGLCSGAVLLSIVYTLTFVKYAPIYSFTDSLLGIYLLGLGCLQFVYLMGVLYFGIILTHRVAGPIYAFKRFVRELLNNDAPKELKLRKGDFFQELEIVAQHLQNDRSELKAQFAQGKNSMSR